MNSKITEAFLYIWTVSSSSSSSMERLLQKRILRYIILTLNGSATTIMLICACVYTIRSWWSFWRLLFPFDQMFIIFFLANYEFSFWCLFLYVVLLSVFVLYSLYSQYNRVLLFSGSRIWSSYLLWLLFLCFRQW